MSNVDCYIQELADKYKYRPLPKTVKEEAHKLYRENLNGFEKKRDTLIDGRPFCKDYERVVVGDYGAYVEIKEGDIIQPLTVPEKQKWRYDKEYLEKKNITIKYYWLEWNGHKVYHQVAGVKYADYKPGFYYISVTAFDAPCRDTNMNPMFEKLSESLVTNSIFTHTDTASAEAFLSDIADMHLDKVNVAIVGDTDITNGRQVSQCFNMLLRMFEHPSNVRVLTGELSGTEQIVRRWARRNQFEMDVYPVIEKPEWVDNGYSNRQDRDRRMLAAAHCVILINKPNSKSTDFMYNASIEAGRFVSRRIVRNV